MKKKYVALSIVLVLVGVAYAATRGFVPRADGEGTLGTAPKNWLTAYIDTIYTDTMVVDLIDTTGAGDMDYGSGDVTDHSFTTDDCTFIIDGGITVSTGDNIVLGSTTWNSGDEIDGEQIKDDTIDNDSIDWGDMTDLTTDGALDADVVDEAHIADDGIDSEHYNDGSIDAVHLAADVIDETKIADDGIDSEHYNDGSIDLVHLAAGVYAKDIVTTSPITGATDNVLVGADGDVTIALTMLKDIVTTAPLTGAENDVLPGADADLTLALDFTAAWNFGGAATLEIPNAESTDAALTALGMLHIRGDEDRISYHVGAGGEVAGEVTVSVLKSIAFSVDPGSWYDSDAEIFITEVHADLFPNGIIIDEWKCSCNVDPDTEISAELYYADAWIGLANAAVIDDVNTTNGVVSEDTDANINSGSAVAAGKFIYLLFTADPEGTCVQMHFMMIFHAEED